MATLVMFVGASSAMADAYSVGASFAATDTIYSQTLTLPVPPASSFSGSAGGDGWGIALSTDKVYNVFHHNGALTVACHLQSNASDCPSYPVTITDGSGTGFETSGHPGMYLDQATGKLYVYATRSSDITAGVVCVDTASASFCGFTALSGIGEADASSSIGDTSVPMLVGHQLYAFNYVSDTGAGGPAGTGTQNRLLCFDVNTDAACAGQPFAVNIGAGTLASFTFPAPATAAIGTRLIIPVGFNDGSSVLACYDTTSGGNCSGAWPVAAPTNYVGQNGTSNGSPFPLLDSAGAIQGLCLPTGTDQCFTLSGASTATPSGLAAAVGASVSWDGPAVQLGPRVYVPVGDFSGTDKVGCYDYSTDASCPNFPKSFPDLGILYTVNSDFQRPTCLWVNSDSGSGQIQSFDAYSGGACGKGAIRVLANQFVVPMVKCYPNSYLSFQVVSPAPGAYTSGTVEFDDGAGNPIPGIPAKPLDATGSVDLTGLALNTATGLPQFLITLNGAPADLGQVVVKLTWSAAYDPACVGGGQTVQKKNTTTTTSLSGGGNTGTSITVAPGTAVTDSAVIAGDNAAAASGTVTYTWYNGDCSTIASQGAALTITTPGTIPLSAPVTLPVGTYKPVATYSGDVGNNGSSSVCGDEVLTVGAAGPPPTTLTVNTATGDFADATTVSAVLTNSNTAAPISGETVTLTLNGTESCSAPTNASGVASCSITPSEAAAVYKLAGSFAGDASFMASTGSANFTVTHEETALSYTGDTSAVNGQSMTLSGVLTTDDRLAGTGLGGKSVTFTLGSGGSAQSCTATTNASGSASCVIASVSQAVGSVPISANFAGDAYYLPATASSSANIFPPTGLGAFVIGDRSAGAPTTGRSVYFWGSQWAKQNSLSGGSAPSSMKGFADSPTPGLACGGTFTTRTGGSSAPPSALPAQIQVIVSSHVTQKGSVISGDITHIVVVQVNPGYGPFPGLVGTGTIVRVVC